MSRIDKEQLSMWILNKLQKEGDPLTRGIDFSETGALIQDLISRLSLSDSVLDLSPNSLKILESSLKSYYHQEIKEINQISERSIISIIREICAYFGRTVIENTDGKWVNRGTLKGTIVEIPGPITVQKGRIKSISNGTRIFLWNIATVLWDNIVTEFETSNSLFKEYQIAKKKKMVGF